MLSIDDANRLLSNASAASPCLADATGLLAVTPLSGGDISQSYKLETRQHTLFLKMNQRSLLPMFEAERAGLTAIAASNTIDTCRVLACGTFADACYLLQEFHEFSAEGNWQLAGEQLAKMHSADQVNRYGFETPTYCGSTLQPNDWNASWADFFSRQRLGHQLSLLYQKPVDHPDIEHYVDCCRKLLDSHQPQPALVHGDLWRGNIAFEDGKPLIFDPATYIGDPETDLAMTELFGRFPAEFYRAYATIIPTAIGYARRRELYQLYHILNHANLFGGAYRSDAERRLRQLF